MEHRYGRRYPVRQPIYLETPDAVIAAGWLTEVSISGGSVITHRPLQEDVRLRVRLLGGTGARSQRRFSIAAHLLRPTQYGWALEWDELQPELLARLDLESQSGTAVASHESTRGRRSRRQSAR